MSLVKSFVMGLLQMSLAGGVMIAAVMAVRALTLRRLPKRTFPVLWYAALARLLAPVSVPCALSVFTLWERMKEAPAAEPLPVSVPAAAPAYVPAAPAYVPPPTAATYVPAAEAAPAPAFSISGETAALLIWLLGAAVCAAFFAVVYLRSRREFNQSLPLENEFTRGWLDGHRLRRRISLRQSDRIGAPLTYGVLRPVILMPKCTDWDDGEAVKYVLEHEFAHVRRFDAAVKLLLTAAVCLHWFNPLVWGMYVLANRDLELACDEAVLRRLGRETRAEYAMTLIRMAEAEGKNGPAPLCSGFGKSAVEERITAIMKMKKTSLAALLVAAGLVVGVTTVFATSAATADKEELDRRANAQAVTSAETVLSIIGEDGKTRYSTDGGKTWMSEEEYEALHPKTEVEWWTYDEYAAWLEKEKVELQGMLGEKGWTQGRGEFVWTQEIIDETIAMYEDILAQIGRGVLVSKTVDGSEDTMLMQSPYDIMLGIGEGEPTAADFAEYAPYGLEWRETEKALFFKGERVRYFIDGAELDVGMAIRFEYADAELKGNIDVHTVRSRVENGDGSYDPTGPLRGLEKYSQAEFNEHTFTIPALEAEAYTQAVIAEEAERTASVLDAYVPFGLSYRTDPATGELSMSYDGHPVHAVSDPEKGVWIANSLNGYYLDNNAVDLEAVYKNGKLAMLLPSRVHSEYMPVDAAPAQDGEMFRETGNGVTPHGSYASGYIRMSDYGVGKGSVALYDRYGNVIGSYDNIFSTDDDRIPPRYLMIKSVGCMCAYASGQDAHGNGIDGYASVDDLYPITWQTTEEMDDYLAAHPEYGKRHDVPLYDENGRVIGTFTISPANISSGPFSDMDEAKEYVKNPGNAAPAAAPVTGTVIAQGTDTGKGEPGRSFADKFKKYEAIQIVYEEAAGSSGKGNVYRVSSGSYQGKRDRYLISHFVDVSPDGSVFTFDSADSGGLSVQTVYDGNGELSGMTVTASPVTAEPLKNGEELVDVNGLVYSRGWISYGYVRAADFDPNGGLVPLYDRYCNAVGCFNNADSIEHMSPQGPNKVIVDGYICIRAVGTGNDGTYPTSGYVRDLDVSPDMGSTPEEITEYINTHPEYGKRHEIPLYDGNGNVIGRFESGGSITIPSSVSSIDEARDYLKNYGNDN